MKQKFYALGAVVCFAMLLGTAGQADAFVLDGRTLVEQAALQVVGFCACIRGAGGGNHGKSELLGGRSRVGAI